MILQAEKKSQQIIGKLENQVRPDGQEQIASGSRNHDLYSRKIRTKALMVKSHSKLRP